MIIRSSGELATTLRDLASNLTELMDPDGDAGPMVWLGEAIGTLRTAAAGIDDLTAVLDPEDTPRPEGEPSYDQRIAAMVLDAYRQGWRDCAGQITTDTEPEPAKPSVFLDPLWGSGMRVAMSRAAREAAAQWKGTTDGPSPDFPGRAGG
jgi:hypothetical protein